jgi:hypothetical protein
MYSSINYSSFIFHRQHSFSFQISSFRNCDSIQVKSIQVNLIQFGSIDSEYVSKLCRILTKNFERFQFMWKDCKDCRIHQEHRIILFGNRMQISAVTKRNYGHSTDKTPISILTLSISIFHFWYFVLSILLVILNIFIRL